MSLGLCFWHSFSGMKRTYCTTGNWWVCRSLELTSSIPPGSTIIYWYYCGFICVSLCQTIRIKPINMYVYMYMYIYMYKESGPSPKRGGAILHFIKKVSILSRIVHIRNMVSVACTWLPFRILTFTNNKYMHISIWPLLEGLDKKKTSVQHAPRATWAIDLPTTMYLFHFKLIS